MVPGKRGKGRTEDEGWKWEPRWGVTEDPIGEMGGIGRTRSSD
jgi:hypothetical protein